MRLFLAFPCHSVRHADALLNRYGKAESHSESAINTLVDAVRKAAGGQQVKMDDWATRYPTNVADVARVLVDLAGARAPASASCRTSADSALCPPSSPSADKSTSTTLPSVLHFSAQQEHTKYTIAQLFAALHTPPLELGDRLVRVSEGPKPGETVRPRDCHLSNVRGVSVIQHCCERVPD